MRKTELLSPAKDKETAFAAIDCGADAVYIGGANFGARKNASNSLEDIKEVVDYAHKFRVKVFVTVNTILTDEELEDALKLVQNYDKIGVDAILVQDMGLLYRLMELGLSIPIHASTQCDNRTMEKICFFNDIGLSRVVLARELSLSQIKEIHEKNPELELETFIHGALCVSYSGQCYLSQYIGGRSANRGECAQPCRKKYIVKDEDGKIYKYNYPLCLKDFNASNYIKELIEIGVYSFKIEGRLKDINYVKNIVSYYRKLLDNYSEKSSSGKSVCNFVPNPEKSFNRGFTEYFLKSRGNCYSPDTPKSVGEYLGKVIDVNKNVIKLVTKSCLLPQDGLCYFSADGFDGFLVNKIITSEKGIITFSANKPTCLKTGDKLYRNSDIQFEKKLSLPVKRQIGVSVKLTDKIELIDEDGYSITSEFPSNEVSEKQDKMNETFIKQFSKTGDSDFYITDIKLDKDIPFMRVSAINQLRRDLLEMLMEKRIKGYKREVQKPMHIVPFYQKEVDYRANVHNKTAEEFYNKCGCVVKEYSPETSFPKHSVELMRTKHCIKYALNMCKAPVNLMLQDEKGVNYPLKFDCKNCEMCVLSPG